MIHQKFHPAYIEDANKEYRAVATFLFIYKNLYGNDTTAFFEVYYKFENFF